MTLITALLVLLVVGVAMYLIHAYLPSPWNWVLLVVCGILLVVFVAQVLGVANLGALRVGG